MFHFHVNQPYLMLPKRGRKVNFFLFTNQLILNFFHNFVTNFKQPHNEIQTSDLDVVWSFNIILHA